MKLFEIAYDDIVWRSNLELKADETDAMRSKFAGHWLVLPDGKRVAGPFKSADAAASFKQNRPDRIPGDAVVRQL